VGVVFTFILESGSGGIARVFNTMMTCPQTWHLKLAALPLILEGSTRYFFPHSSQMTIIYRTPQPERAGKD
jgi:hypothetical protein